jgi:hypothetical protein
MSKTKKRCLVLGFYDRGNAGDEAYKVSIPTALGTSQASYEFVGMDDAIDIPGDIDIVIVGGGDIISSYFISKFLRILNGSSYSGPIYAYSVGIPYQSESRFFRVFDHVFVRSRSDKEVAVAEVGMSNVSLIPDAALSMPVRGLPGPPPIQPQGGPRRKAIVGVCLAQPFFYQESPDLVSALSSALVSALSNVAGSAPDGARVVFFAFNTSGDEHESDHVINETMRATLASQHPGVEVEISRSRAVVSELIADMNRVDVMVCMRFHSLVFSRLLSKPAVAVYASPKVGRAVADFPPHGSFNIRDGVDASFSPRLSSAILGALGALGPLGPQGSLGPLGPVKTWHPPTPSSWNDSRDIIFKKMKLAYAMPVRPAEGLGTIEEAKARVVRLLGTYLGLTEESDPGFMTRVGKFPLTPTFPGTPGTPGTPGAPVAKKRATDVARVICYGVLGTVSSSSIWGLSENMEKDSFCLDDAISYIYGAELPSNVPSTPSKVVNVAVDTVSYEDRIFVDIEPYLRRQNYEGIHRSGWAYAVGGLRNFDAASMMREGRPGEKRIVLDTYVDRTFHWGEDALTAAGVLPLSSDWFGIVHHTFDTTHSSYNCTELFKKPVFLDSLTTCVALIALSDTLASKLRTALDSVDARHVRVVSLRHPMEVVLDVFTMSKFFKNRKRRVVQIGAWLRNPYSIYALRLWRNPLQLKKSALRGKDMDLYFPPSGINVSICTCSKCSNDLTFGHSPQFQDSQDGSSGTSGTSGQCEEMMCRPCGQGVSEGKSRDKMNKYYLGMVESLEESLNDVEVVERLTDQEYDDLLSSNIVFLDLVDCSAVNTVLECVVRNTPLCVRRNATLEEVLGKDYPGFYDDLIEATLFLNDVAEIERCHAYLCDLDKSRLSLSRFVKDVQDVVHGTTLSPAI